MIPFSPTLPWFELARFRRSRLTRVALVAVAVVPLLYGALYIWANINPTNNLDKIDAAIVNHDQLVEVEDRDGGKQPVAIGRLLAANLISNDDGSNYDWHLTDASDANRGLADGRYKAVLTIPKNLSAAATSTSGDPSEAIQGRLNLSTNDSVNYINGTIAETILADARKALNAQVTETYLDNIYLGFTDIRMALDEAAGGAGQLADGAGTLVGGTEQLADGARQLDAGAGQLAGGLKTLDSRTNGLPGQTRQLADGARQVAAGTGQLNVTIQQITSAILAATANANADIDRLAATLDQLADDCEADPPPGISCSTLRDAAARSDELKGFVGDVRGQVSDVSANTQRLASGADQVADGNEALAANVPSLVNAIGQAADGASQLAGGTGPLADGAAQAADGAAQLENGAAQLQAGLVDGRDGVPDYDKDERELLAKTAATPVEEAAKRLHGVDGYGSALAPYFMALALWVGAMAIYLLLRPLSARAVASTAGSVRTALAGFAPGLLLSFVQAVLLVAVVHWVVGVDAARPLLLLGAALAAAIVFTALNQMFVALFGPAGRFVAIVFVCLQLTSAGGTYPIETSPGFFGTLHTLMPMTYVVDLFRSAVAGGGSSVGADFAVLAVFTLGALAVTSLAAYRSQRVTISRLHPTLVV